MKPLFLFIVTGMTLTVLVSCSGKVGKAAGAGDSDVQKITLGTDTAKLKAEVDNIMRDLTNNKLPDTNKLKQTTEDVLTTTANVLSDSGIDAMGGNDQSAGVAEAKNLMKKMRDSMGINPALLDSMRNSAKQLAPAR